jgi:hydroxymethylbilane synthase
LILQAKTMHHKRNIKLGARGSALALWQADYIKKLLYEQISGIKIEIITISTQGDRDQASSLTVIGGQGIFTKAIEESLLRCEVDIAVHSMKDLPSGLDNRLSLAAVPLRASVADVLITREGNDLNAMKTGAVIGSGSLRRRAQLLHLRDDLQVLDLRGNIDTRLNKLKKGNYDAIIMAEAALQRLKVQDVAYYKFMPDQMIPAVGQGAIAIEIRSDDTELMEIVNHINHPASFCAVTAERAFLHTLDSGCQFPVGAYAVCNEKQVRITGFAASEDGKELIKSQVVGSIAEPEVAGKQLAEKLITKGAKDLLNDR